MVDYDEYLSDNTPKEETEQAERSSTYVSYIVYALIISVAVLFFGLPIFIGFFSNADIPWEVRIYISMFLAYVFLMTFGILRLYNAIKGNSKIQITSTRRQEKVGRDFKSAASDIRATFKTMDTVTRSMNKLSDKIEKWIHTINTKNDGA